MLTLKAILIDEDPTQEKYANEFCIEMFKSYPFYYYKLSYGTRIKWEEKGIASFTCQKLIAVVKATDPNVIITAKTALEENASNHRFATK